MQKLELRHRHALNAAEGWLELGNPTEAEAELNSLPPEIQTRATTLELRWRILASARRWDKALQVAETLVQADADNPAGWVNRAYCLHELQRTQAAWESLLPASRLFPTVPTVAYNLACYACQLDRPKLAMQWLQKAARLLGRNRVKRLAAQDPDLAPLQHLIQKL